MAWTTSKKTWAVFNSDGSRQYFNPSDYARITGNLAALWSFLTGLGYALGTMFSMRSMDYSGIPTASDCNAVEGNLDTCAKMSYTPSDYKPRRTFAGDGNDAAWNSADLNRIESLTGEIYTGMQNSSVQAPRAGQWNFYSGCLYP